MNFLVSWWQDGSILAWKSNSESHRVELVATLKGHRSSVLSLVVGCSRLYSGSEDRTIRVCSLVVLILCANPPFSFWSSCKLQILILNFQVWDVKTLQCLHTLNGHSSSVTAVLCWDSYLLSGSLDNTLKVCFLAPFVVYYDGPPIVIILLALFLNCSFNFCCIFL